MQTSIAKADMPAPMKALLIHLSPTVSGELTIAELSAVTVSSAQTLILNEVNNKRRQSDTAAIRILFFFILCPSFQLLR